MVKMVCNNLKLILVFIDKCGRQINLVIKMGVTGYKSNVMSFSSCFITILNYYFEDEN